MNAVQENKGEIIHYILMSDKHNKYLVSWLYKLELIVIYCQVN